MIALARRWLLLALAAWIPAAAQAADHPQLGYLQRNTEGRVELRLADPATGRSFRVQLLRSAPLLGIWRRDRPEVITVRDGGLYRTDYRAAPDSADPVGDDAPKGLQLEDAWIARDGKTLLAVGAMAGAGGASSCTLYAVPESGAWRRLESPHPVPASADEGCDGFARDERAGALSISSVQLARRQQCTAPGSPCDSLGGKPGDRYADLRRRVAESAKGLDGVAIADPGATPYLLATGMQMGDSPHMSRPVYLVSRAGLQLKTPALHTEAQVQIDLAGRYALVAGEFNGKNPMVLDLESGQSVLSLPGASDAAWTP